jgi:hypothetical protein
MTRIVYLHGFASSPQSSKARFFEQKFLEQGVPFDAPRLDEGDFSKLTIAGQQRVIERTVAGGPVVLMGSSLGGYLAALYAAQHPDQVEKLVLLAPAFHFPSRWKARFTPEELAAWKQHGTKTFFHYGDRQNRELGYQLVEEAGAHEDEPAFTQPALIIHGRNDDVVPAAASEHFAQGHPNAKLLLVDSGHELTDVTDQLWSSTAAFLGYVIDSNWIARPKNIR